MSRLQQICLGCVAGFLLHEVGHLIAASLCGVRVKRVGVSLTGFYIVREAGSRAANIAISLSGPLANLLVAVLAWHPLYYFAQVNLILGLCNLLPVSGTDGQRVLGMLRTTKGASLKPEA